MKFDLYASVAATPKSEIDSANPIASADMMAGARIGTISRSARHAGRAVHPGGVLELLPEPVKRGGDRQVGERHAAQPEQQHDAERAP